jgi:hypothetical protein
MISVGASASRLVLRQIAVARKSNEITTIPALLRLLDAAPRRLAQRQYRHQALHRHPR